MQANAERALDRGFVLQMAAVTAACAAIVGIALHRRLARRQAATNYGNSKRLPLLATSGGAAYSDGPSLPVRLFEAGSELGEPLPQHTRY